MYPGRKRFNVGIPRGHLTNRAGLANLKLLGNVSIIKIEVNFTNGAIGNAPINLTGQQLGSFTYTDGSIGNAPYNTTKQQIGNFDFTNGSVDGRSINSTAQQLGNFKYSDGSLGGFGLGD